MCRLVGVFGKRPVARLSPPTRIARSEDAVIPGFVEKWSIEKMHAVERPSAERSHTACYHGVDSDQSSPRIGTGLAMDVRVWGHRARLDASETHMSGVCARSVTSQLSFAVRLACAGFSRSHRRMVGGRNRCLIVRVSAPRLPRQCRTLLPARSRLAIGPRKAPWLLHLCIGQRSLIVAWMRTVL